MKLFFSFSIFSLLLISFSGCKKVEGPGGSSTIKGVVHANVYDGAGNLINNYDIPKEDVYIIYGGGDETFYDDDVKTSYDGSFRFDYLEKGNYKIFVYEKCTTCPSGKAIVMVDVEITDKKSEIVLDTIYIRK